LCCWQLLIGFEVQMRKVVPAFRAFFFPSLEGVVSFQPRGRHFSGKSAPLSGLVRHINGLDSPIFLFRVLLLLTMVEPISIIGGIAAVIQLAKYGFRFIQSASEYPLTFRNAPDTIERLMNDVEGFLNIAQSLDPKPHEVGHSTVLYSLIDRSVSSATSLQKLLQTFAIDKSDPRSIRLKKSLSFTRKAKTISKCLLDIERCKGNLNLHIST
jgi:hypothetical protein